MNELILKTRQSGRMNQTMEHIKTTILDGKNVFIWVNGESDAARMKDAIKTHDIPCEIEEVWDPDKKTGLSGRSLDLGTYDELTGNFYPPAPFVPRLTGLKLKPKIKPAL